MSIAYNFEVIAVDQAARVMEVVYTSEGRQTMHICARLPYAGEELEAVIAMYAPVAYWLEQDAAVQEVEVGATGTVDAPGVDNSLEAIKARKKAEIAEIRWRYEVAGTSANGYRVRTDRESQAAVNNAYALLSSGRVSSLDWKAADGSFVTVQLPELTAIANAISRHVQAMFTTERALVEQVDAATTEQEVHAAVWPM